MLVLDAYVDCCIEILLIAAEEMVQVFVVECSFMLLLHQLDLLVLL